MRKRFFSLLLFAVWPLGSVVTLSGCDSVSQPSTDSFDVLAARFAAEVVNPSVERIRVSPTKAEQLRSFAKSSDLTYQQALDLMYTQQEQEALASIRQEMLRLHPEIATMTSEELEAFMDPTLDVLFPETASKQMEIRCASEIRKHYLSALGMGIACGSAASGVTAPACLLGIAIFADAALDLRECYRDS